MKRLFTVLFIIFLIIIPTVSYSANIYLFGIRAKDLKSAKWHHMLLGAISCILVHELAHFAILELAEVEYTSSFSTSGTFTLSGPVMDKMSGHTGRSIARAGYIAQHGTNLALIIWKEKSSFTHGFRIFSAAQTLSYSLRTSEDESDFTMIDRFGGDGDEEYEIVCNSALHNLFKIEW